MNQVLLAEMKRLVEAGDKRKNAATTLLVAGIEMMKRAEALKAASKAYATAASQMDGAFAAAHEMTDDELKGFKKLYDRVEDTIAGLKKYTLYAEDNAQGVSKTAAALHVAVPLPRIGQEPDPNRPFQKAPPIPKPNFNAGEWGLEDKPGVDAVVAAFNKAAWKVIDKMDDVLPSRLSPSGVYLPGVKPEPVMTNTFEAYMKPLLKKYAADFSQKDATGRLIAFQMVMQRMNDWGRTLTGNPKLKWVWTPPPKMEKPPLPKETPPAAPTWKSVWKK